MHQSVRDAFIKVTAPIDGMFNHMYCQNKVVIAGIGINLPTATEAQQLSWRWRDSNKRATSKEIAAEWEAVKWVGRLEYVFAPAQFVQHTKLMLPNKEIYRSAYDKMNLAESKVKAVIHGYERWPADAQLAAIQLVLGYMLTTELIDMLSESDFAGATECLHDVDPRSVLVKHLLTNAVTVLETELNNSKLLPLAH